MSADSDQHHLKLRQTQPEDYEDIAEIMDRVYPGKLDGAWTREQFDSQIHRFPEGHAAKQATFEVALLTARPAGLRFADGTACPWFIGGERPSIARGRP